VKEDVGTSMTGVIYDYLMDMILSLQMKPGDRIPEMKIAKEFGVSRTPIRDALRQLAGDGIINVYPKRYAEVADYDDEKVRQIGLTRIALDTLAIRLANYYGSNAEFMALQEYADACYEATKAQDVAVRIKMDSAFHFELCKIGKNDALTEMERRLLLQLEFLQAIRYDRAQDPDNQYQSHCGLINALMKRDVKEAVRIITEHDVNFHDLRCLPKSLYMAEVEGE